MPAAFYCYPVDAASSATGSGNNDNDLDMTGTAAKADQRTSSSKAAGESNRVAVKRACFYCC